MSRREKIEQMLRESPEDVFLNYSHAMELAKAEEVPAARTTFARVRELDPDYVSAYFQEGQMLARAGETQAAREILKQGIDVARRIGDDHALGEMSEFLETL
jgi:predicted Zn-dependent protease